MDRILGNILIAIGSGGLTSVFAESIGETLLILAFLLIVAFGCHLCWVH